MKEKKETDMTIQDFWEEYLESDERKRAELIAETKLIPGILELAQKNKKELAEFAIAQLINCYLKDLIKVIRNERK